MFVAKYPDWVSAIVFKDGGTVFFDGAKDLFKYYFDLNRYNPGQDITNIASVYVTEYYNMTLIDARKSHYVIGSDVYGPMGRELVPFKNRPEAAEFLKDHRGQKVVRFKDIAPALIESLD